MPFDSKSPHDTPTLLIDFDHAEVIRNNREQLAQCQTVVRCRYLLLWVWLMARQGTPVFMARAVVAGHHLANERWFGLCDLPLLSGKARQLYEAKLPKRLGKFPQPASDQNEILCVLQSSELRTNHLQFHELRHDAELLGSEMERDITPARRQELIRHRWRHR